MMGRVCRGTESGVGNPRGTLIARVSASFHEHEDRERTAWCQLRKSRIGGMSRKEREELGTLKRLARPKMARRLRRSEGQQALLRCRGVNIGTPPHRHTVVSPQTQRMIYWFLSRLVAVCNAAAWS